jgi:ABC-type branched-subunit amino acid transport system ATPase component
LANRSDPTPLLEVRQLAVAYGDVQVLWDASLTIDEGSVTALLGPNGAGKSTMLKTIMGLTPPLRGEIIFGGQPIQHLSPHRITELGVSLILEGGRPFADMTVAENLDLGANSRRARARADQARAEVFELFVFAFKLLIQALKLFALLNFAQNTLDDQEREYENENKFAGAKQGLC